MQEKVLIINCNGVLIKKYPINFKINDLDKLIFEPDVITTLLLLKKNKFKFIMIVKQNYLNNKILSLENFYIPHYLMINILNSQGIFFDEILVCPHLFEINCFCIYQQICFISLWFKKNVLDLSNSYFISSKITDMELANKIGINGLFYKPDILSWKKIGKKLINFNRCVKVTRKTSETLINIKLCLDKNNKSIINTGIFFFNHMLQQIATHSRLYLNIIAQGDIYIDSHHIIEDTAIIFGKALRMILGNKYGICRFGFVLPMDECLSFIALDISDRPYLKYYAKYFCKKIGDLNTEMIEHFFYSLSYSLGCSIHIYAIGKNDHHKAECIFKSFGQVLYQAIKVDKKNILLTSKGIL